MPTQLPKALSPGEEAYALHCRVDGLKPEREYRFCERKWKVDFAFPMHHLAVEIEGGTWTAGRHSRGAGYEKDLEKYNRLTLMGWRLLRFTTQMVMSGEAIETTKAALGIQ